MADVEEPVTDVDLWFEVGEDPTEYVHQLRRQGRVGPMHSQQTAVKLPSTTPNVAVVHP